MLQLKKDNALARIMSISSIVFLHIDKGWELSSDIICDTICKQIKNIITDFSSVQYKDHEEVVLWMNTVGPYHNRQETYAYFSLPFCVGTKPSISHYHETLSEALQGVELEFSGYEIDFKGKSIQSC